jgi:3-phenylpropionate/trans-cinnamate dioxygenase ferredoxin component
MISMAGNWIEVATTTELPLGKMKRVEIDGHRYLLANGNGTIYAVDDQCSHEDVSLYLGCIQGDKIKCSLHGSRFSLKTGQALEDPATDPIGTYEVHIESGKVHLKPK